MIELMTQIRMLETVHEMGYLSAEGCSYLRGLIDAYNKIQAQGKKSA